MTIRECPGHPPEHGPARHQLAAAEHSGLLLVCREHTERALGPADPTELVVLVRELVVPAGVSDRDRQQQ